MALWLPPTGPGPYPLVLFSHAFGGCKTQSSYLMRVLAQNGILVAAPDHRDSRCGERLSLDLPPIFHNPGSWSDSTYADRRDNLHELRTGLLMHPTLATSIDPAHVALVGHSLGGYTVLALAGARTGWKMNVIDGAVALAPYTDPFLTGGTPESISVPVLVDSCRVDPAPVAGGLHPDAATIDINIMYEFASKKRTPPDQIPLKTSSVSAILQSGYLH